MTRPLRKDALERRRALLTAAAHVLAEQGLDAPLEAIAERAGVGRATLYRNFPDRLQLALAVLTQEVDDLAARTLALGPGPDAFFGFLEDLAEVVVRNASFSVALRSSAPEMLAPVRRTMVEAGAGPLRQAQAAGRVRPDLAPADLLLIANLLGAGLSGDTVDRRAVAARARSLVLDGLRTRP